MLELPLWKIYCWEENRAGFFTLENRWRRNVSVMYLLWLNVDDVKRACHRCFNFSKRAVGSLDLAPNGVQSAFYLRQYYLNADSGDVKRLSSFFFFFFFFKVRLSESPRFIALFILLFNIIFLKCTFIIWQIRINKKKKKFYAQKTNG